MTADTTGDGRVDDIGEVVRCQHRVLRRLFGDVEAARGRRRLEVLEDLVRYLAVHETLEEDLVYPALRAAGPDGARVADARRDEEREATAMLHDLQGVGSEGDERPTRRRGQRGLGRPLRGGSGSTIALPPRLPS